MTRILLRMYIYAHPRNFTPPTVLQPTIPFEPLLNTDLLSDPGFGEVH